MRILLDTDVLLWVLLEPPRIDRDTHATLEDSTNEVLFSAASIWEIAIKFGLRRADFTVAPRRSLKLPLTRALKSWWSDGMLPRWLPSCRCYTPFDRLLVAPAIVEPAVLYTVDPQLPPYSELVRLIGTR